MEVTQPQKTTTATAQETIWQKAYHIKVSWPLDIRGEPQSNKSG